MPFFLDELRRYIHREREVREKAERQSAALQRGKGNSPFGPSFVIFDCLTVFVYQFLEFSIISRKTGGSKKTVVVRCIDLQEGRCDYFKRRDGLI